MPTRPTSRNLWKRLNSLPAARHWLVWLLCLCAWRGPVPVVHCHHFELDPSATATESDWILAEHVAAWHADEYLHADQQSHGDDSGWHVHFVLPSSTDDDKMPLDQPVLAELITHNVGGSSVDVPVSSHSIDPLADFVGPFTQPSLSPTVPKLIPLAPPRSRPSRVSPRIYYCVVQC